MRRIVLALAGAVVWGACGGARPTPKPPEVVPIEADAGAVDGDAAAATTPAASNRNAKKIARTLSEVSELRGLTAKREVPGETLERHALVEAVKEKALREYPAEAIKREGTVLQLFGFAPPGFDYLREMMGLLESQLEGFYDPKTGTMFLAGDLRGEQARATLAHELVHALQDQHWDLKKRSTYRPGRGDETMALAALAEGDATSLMLDYVMKARGQDALALPDEMLGELMRSSISVGDAANAPHVLRTTLVAPYVEGVAFVHALRRKGGWRAVDAAWAAPPVTTEQVLHPEKFATHEPAITVAAPPGPTGFTKVDEDTYGELGLSLMFGEWMTTEDAKEAAKDWGGDRGAVYTKGDEIAVAIRVRYDDGRTKPDAHAARAFSKLFRGLTDKLGATSPAGGGWVCASRKDTGPMGVLQVGRDVVIVAGPAKPGTGTWTSASNCTGARQWAKDIAASAP